jgi:hypothetical protein
LIKFLGGILCKVTKKSPESSLSVTDSLFKRS